MSEHQEMIRASYAAKCALEVIEVSKMYRKYVNIAAEKSNSVAKRVDAIRTFRNNKVLDAIPVMLNMVKDNSEDEYLRTAAAEVLGWYIQSADKSTIISTLTAAKADVNSELVKKEIKKTLRRLE